MATDRRQFIRNLILGAGMISIFPGKLIAGDSCGVQHPFMPARPEFKGVCHNCGMMRPMWARTWHTYTSEGETLHVCSMHCLAEATLNAGTSPENVQAALYLDPATTIPADQAFYVVGSRAPGTMTMNSKLAFATKEEAEKFAAECGGSVVQFSDAYQAAQMTIAKENKMIDSNRHKKGKIVEPVDNKDACPVCGMYAARFPKNKCQLQTKDGEVLHFCCTQCLFEFVKNSGKYKHPEPMATLVWVVDYESGNWIYAKNAYYVIGTKVQGPMGKEAFPFVNVENARNFASANSGKVERFDSVTIDNIMM
jgi:nitrous oxide reductase accessory protein NosL